MFVQQRPGIEQRLGERGANIPESGPCLEQVTGRECGRSPCTRDGELRQHVGNRHSGLRGGEMQVLFRLAHVRTLLYELRRQADREIARQGQFVELKRLRRLFGG